MIIFLGVRNSKNKENLIDLTNTKAEKPQAKRKAQQPSSSKNSKQRKIENDNIDKYHDNKLEK